MKINDIGYCLDDPLTMYIVDTIWLDGELTLIDIADDTNVRHVNPSDFWALVNVNL